MTEHEPVVVLAPAVHDGPPSVQIYCGAALVAAYKDAADGKYYCSSCAKQVRVAW